MTLFPANPPNPAIVTTLWIHEIITSCFLVSKRMSTPDLQWYYNKTEHPQKSFDVTINAKPSLDEHHINIYKTANKKLNTLSRINHYMKQNQKKSLL